jgi:L-asparaginase II
MPKTYNVELTYEEIEFLSSCVYNVCGGKHEQFMLEANKQNRDMWHKLRGYISEESYVRDLIRECDKYGYD